MRWLRFGLLLAVLLLTVSSAQAQGGTISYGQAVMGYISNGGIDEWTFYGNGGDVISISMYADGPLDTYVTLLDGNRNWLAENDDYYGLDAAIIDFWLPGSGNYIIRATGFGEGGYSLNLTLVTPGSAVMIPDQPIQPDAPAQPVEPIAPVVPDVLPAQPSINNAAPPSVGVISYGQTLTGETTGAVPQLAYQFYGSANDHVVITMSAQAGSLDPYLILTNAAGGFVGENDDYGVNLDSQIVATLPADGNYTIQATGLNGSVGRFTLSLALSSGGGGPGAPAAPLPAPAAPVSGGGDILFGQLVTGTITYDKPQDLYAFPGTQSDSVTITMTGVTAGFDCLLVLNDPQGNPVAENDDYNGTTHSQIVATLPVTGTYVVVASAFNNASTGQYTILVEQSAAPAAPVAPVAPAGDIVAIDSSLDSIQVGEVLPGFGVPANVAVFQPPVAFNAPPSNSDVWLAYGDMAQGELTAAITQVDYYFTSNKDDIITINAIESGNLNVSMELLNPDGSRLATGYEVDRGVRISGLTLDSTGTYAIQIRSVNNTTGSYELHLVREADPTPGDGSNVLIPDGVGEPTDEFCCLSPQPEGKHVFHLDAEQARNYEITVESLYSDMIPQVVIMHSDGRVIEAITNQEGAATVRIDFYAFYTGRFLIHARARAGSGRFRFSAVESEVGDSISGGPIAYHTVFTDQIAGTNHKDVWNFEGRAGDVIAIRMDFLDPTMDPFLVLRDPANEIVASNGNINGSNKNAMINYTLTETGNYKIEAMSENVGYGRYQLWLTLRGTGGNAPPLPGNASPTPTATNEPFPIQGKISVPGTVTGRINNCSEVHYWEIDRNLKRDSTLNVMARKTVGNLNLKLTLFQDHTIVGQNDDGDGMGTDAWIQNYEVFLEVPHFIEVGCTSGSGDYVLTVEALIILSQ